MKFEHVRGTHKNHHVRIYTLSTCGWCKKTKDLLKSLEVEYEYIDVDLLSDDDTESVRAEVKQYNPNMTYPTIVIDNGKRVITGFKDDEIRQELG